MNLQELYRKIELPEEVCFVIERMRTDIPEQMVFALTEPQNAAKTYRQLAEKALPLNFGLDLLLWMLQAALYSHDAYTERGISDDVYFDTMKCFTRFVNEHKMSYGFYGFDRAFWVYRQLSLTLFRVGELEYEFTDCPQGISLHIPSDADISVSQCRRSLMVFENFCETTFPEKMCHSIQLNSWLLSPALKNLLPPSSRIIQFQNCFDCTAWDKEDIGFLQWIYGRGDIDLHDLPEKTRLQKNVKRHLLEGKKIGSACGILKNFDENR